MENNNINPCDFARWLLRMNMTFSLRTRKWHYGNEKLRDENEMFTDEEMQKYYLEHKDEKH